MPVGWIGLPGTSSHDNAREVRNHKAFPFSGDWPLAGGASELIAEHVQHTISVAEEMRTKLSSVTVIASGDLFLLSNRLCEH